MRVSAMSVGQQFNLRWNNHTNNILQVLMEQFAGEHLVDCTLSCQGQFLKVHKMILSACSPYFQELFRQHQVHHPVIIMNGMKFNDIKLAVEFMYRGEIKVLETDLDGLLATAETLQVKGLSNVRNKYEKGDIQGNEQTHLQRSELVQTTVQGTSVTQAPGTPTYLKRKRRKCSDSPITEDLGEKDDLDVASANITPSSISEKGMQDFKQVSVKPYAEDDDLPTTFKIEPPDIRDIDEEPCGWESPKLVIDLPDPVVEQSAPTCPSPKPSPKTSKSAPKGNPSDIGKSQQLKMEVTQETPGTSKRNNDIVQQLLENEREHKQVSRWLRERTGKIPRPPNAFMIFANEWRRKLAFQHPTESNKEISVRLGVMWKNLSSDIKEGYYTASRQADEEHKKKYPGYYYSPKEARLRKTLKHDLAMARKGPKNLEAMHLVKVLMNDSNENPPYVFVQDSPQQSQQREQQNVAQRKKTSHVIKTETPENELLLQQNFLKGNTSHLVKETLTVKDANAGKQCNDEVNISDEKFPLEQISPPPLKK